MQSIKVPLEEFISNCRAERYREYLPDTSNIENEVVKVRVAVRLDSRSDYPFCIWPANLGDKGAFIAWAWPRPYEFKYPILQETEE